MAAFDPDYALAVILQAKYNKEEAERKKKQFKENVVVPSVPQVVTNSLVDPIWETTDPTPDVHALFLAFNKRFFWGKLDSVEVSWSSRLKSSAGVCSYQNRSGYCSVRLSAPLLKLRPRSDLVETLLHELIHAYLFVTNNDRDRDGHGPMFQSHMCRINKEAGTNITIYHSFHDEVELYRQHWWRCDGPCQNKRPYFGFVKRSMNRAPGPSDIWWTEHKAMCNGTFIKIKEPNGFTDKKKLTNNQNAKNSPNPKITGFFKPSSSTSTINNTKIVSGSNSFRTVTGIKDLTIRSGSIESPKILSKSDKNVFSFKDLTNSNLSRKSSTGAIKKSRFTKPQTEVSAKDKKNHKTSGKYTINGFQSGMLSNRGAGTLVVTSTDRKNERKEDIKEHNANIVPFSGAGYVLGNKAVKKNISKQNSEILSTNIRDFGKSKPFEPTYNKAKQIKLENVCEVIEICEEKCPLCDITVAQNKMHAHLQNCIRLSSVFDSDDNFKPENNCPNCNIIVSQSDIDVHLVKCASLTNKCCDDNDLSTNEICKCPVCNKNISRNEMNSHFEDCAGLSTVFNNSSTLEDSDDEEEIDEKSKVSCPCCSKQIKVLEINKHLDECLNILLISELE